MLFHEPALATLVENLNRMGLSTCPICGGSQFLTDKRPVVMYVGGNQELNDKNTNAVFLLRVICDGCGYVLLFDAERHMTGDDPILEFS